MPDNKATELIDLSFEKIFFGMSCMAGLIMILYYGSAILIPFSLALLFSFILYPVCFKLESWGVNRIFSASITLALVTILLSGLIFLLSSQMASIVDNLSNFEMKLKDIFAEIIKYFNRNVSVVPRMSQENILDQGQDFVKESGGSLVATTLDQTSSIFSGALISFVYTFLILIYRGSLKQGIQKFAASKHHETVGAMINEMQKVGQSYLFGMTIMILILGATNSIILLLFGLDNAIFFGFLAALLAVIPYVGTVIGAAIPVIYAFMTHDAFWTPIGIVISFGVVQIVESNYLSPKIVGGNLNINALAAILTLILGGSLWGVAGMILFLPFTAIFKVFCGYYKPLHPLSFLLGIELRA